MGNLKSETFDLKVPERAESPCENNDFVEKRDRARLDKFGNVFLGNIRKRVEPWGFNAVISTLNALGLGDSAILMRFQILITYRLWRC